MPGAETGEKSDRNENTLEIKGEDKRFIQLIDSIENTTESDKSNRANNNFINNFVSFSWIYYKWKW